MRRLTVVFTADAFVKQRDGGVSRYFGELGRELVGLGVDARVVAPLHDSQALQHSPVPVTGRRVRGLPPAACRTISGVLARPLEYAQYAQAPGPSVLHPTYYPVAVSRRTRLAITVYDLIQERYPQWFGARHRARCYAKRRLVETADVVFAISQHTRDGLLDATRVDPDRVVVTPLASRFALDGRLSEPAAPTVLYVGRRNPRYKNFATLLAALARTRARADLRLVLFGGEPLSPTEKATLAAMGLLDRTTHTGGDDDALARAYRAASVLVVPSVEEGFGLPVVEAMTLGCPVVASSGGSLPEVGGDAARFFDPHSPEELAVLLDAVIGDDALRLAMAGAGFAQAATFSWRHTASLTLDGYARATALAPIGVP